MGQEERVLHESDGRGGSAEGMGMISDCHTAFLCNGSGRYAEALTAAARACKSHREFGFATVVLPELIEAACRTGDPDRASRAFGYLAQATRACGTEWALGIEARSRALVSERSDAERFYCEAIERLGRAQVRMDLGRAHLLYGEWLRRENRRLDARGELRMAHEMFGGVGAEEFSERARRELLATGETVRKRKVETRYDLTAQEVEIARLAGDGRTNPEIGVELFISPKTVEWHLRKVYPKLGIRSRRELRVALPAHLQAAS